MRLKDQKALQPIFRIVDRGEPSGQLLNDVGLVMQGRQNSVARPGQWLARRLLRSGARQRQDDTPHGADDEQALSDQHQHQPGEVGIEVEAGDQQGQQRRDDHRLHATQTKTPRALRNRRHRVPTHFQANG